MNNQLKKYLSVFLLFLFLFPMVEKEIHSLEHKADVHCGAVDKHFHSIEHSCSICDFTNTTTTTAPETHTQFIVPVQEFLFLPFMKSPITTFAFHHLPARAPPVA